MFKHSDNKDDIVQGSTASNAPTDVSVTLTCGYMMNYVGQRGQYVVTVGLKMIHSAEVFNMFFTDEWWN